MVCTYVWIFENGANVKTTILTLFQVNTQDFLFNQPQTVCQHTAYSPTLLVCFSLTSSHEACRTWLAKAVLRRKEVVSLSTMPLSVSLPISPAPTGDKTWALPLVSGQSINQSINQLYLKHGKWLSKLVFRHAVW